MRELPTATAFTTGEAADAGLTSSALRHAVRIGELLRPRRGVYLRADAPPELACTAANRVIAGSVICDRSAILLHGLPLLGPEPSEPELTLPPGPGGAHPGVRVYRATLRKCDVVRVGDAIVTSVARTCIDFARHASLDSAVALIDAALHRQMTTRAELEDVLRFCWNWPGIRRAQRAVGLSDGRSESPLESISRLVIPRLGFPAPEPQVWIYDERGVLVGRGDFYWAELGIIGEADGRLKYREDDAFPQEKVRQEDFEDLNLIVVRWGWEHAWRRHDVLRRKLARGFERGEHRRRSGEPRLWTACTSDPDGLGRSA
jgi:hypothetical protein